MLVRLTVEQLGDALSYFLCREADQTLKVLPPVRITASSLRLTPTEIMEFEVSREALEEPLAAKEYEIGYQPTRHTLGRSEVLHALSYYLCFFVWRRVYDGNHVRSVSITLPDTVEVELQFDPRGTTRMEALPHFDGSL